MGGANSLVHFHELDGRSAELTLAIAGREGSRTRLLVRREGERPLELEPRPRPTRLSVPLEQGATDVDLFIEAAAAEPAPILFRIHEITLRRAPEARSRLGRLLPALAGLLVSALLCAVGRRLEALLWSLLAVSLSVGLWIAVIDPAAGLQWSPGSRETLRLSGVVALWLCALIRAPSVPTAVAAVAGTIGLLHLPSLRGGFVNEDFDFARAWSWREIASAFGGSWDPRGILETYYRPLVSLSLAGDYWIWGARPGGFHFTNLLIQCVLGILAYALVGRLGLSRRAALLAALAWVAHPLSASAAAWCNQRTDGLMAVFYLAALLVLAREGFTRSHALAAGALALLALGAKETAVTLPIAAYLLTRLAPIERDLAARRWAVKVVSLVVIGYLAFWLSLFPGRIAERAQRAEAWEGFDPREAEPGQWARLVPGLYALVLIPRDYPWWQATSLGDWSPLYLAGGLLVAPIALAVLAWRKERQPARVALLGLLWPMISVAPLLGANEVDLFRLGLLLSFGSALIWGSLYTVLDRSVGRVSLIVAAALALWLAPRSIATAAVWAPGGFYHSMLPAWRHHLAPLWWDGLSPDMRRLFYEQVSREAHLNAPLGEE